MDVTLEISLLSELQKHYPGHYWMVECNIRQGMINVYNLLLSGKYGFRLQLGGIFSYSQVAADVMRAGGELLERFNLPRGKFNVEKWLCLPVNSAGRPLFDKG